jgi:hypothetical protein
MQLNISRERPLTVFRFAKPPSPSRGEGTLRMILLNVSREGRPQKPIYWFGRPYIDRLPAVVVFLFVVVVTIQN